MRVSVEKPGTPAELVHFGVKGMKWGVHKEQERTGPRSSIEKDPFWTPERKATAKKVAIGVGVLTAVAGAGFVTYQLGQSGKLPISALNKKPSSAISPKAAPAVKKILSEPTDIIHASRGRNKGFEFFKKGGVPDPLLQYEKAFGANSGKTDLFERLDDGKLAVAFLDPKGRKDFAGRTIPHQVLVPKSMSEGINNISDFYSKIWPKLEETYKYEH